MAAQPGIRGGPFLSIGIAACFFFLISAPVSAEETDPASPPDTVTQQNQSGAPPVVYEQGPPSLPELGKNIVFDLGLFAKRIDPRTTYKEWIALTAGTVLLVVFDQDILDASQRLARRLRLISDTKSGREGRTVVNLSIGGLELPVRVPQNLNSGLYFIGDGLPHVLIAGGLASYGFTTGDKRSLNTSAQLVESLVVTGIVVQLVKRITGRESPNQSTKRGGKWRWFPSPRKYSSNVSKYDAVPSGHLASAMATVTVLAANYPDYPFIKPVGYTLMALNGFAMLNNGVHWASDYPLGIVIGYLAADIAIERGKARRRSGGDARVRGQTGLRLDTIWPLPVGADGFGAVLNFRF
jgi:hypothetical protein